MGSEAKRTATFDVWTLDVWGHGADDCEEEHKEGCAAFRDDGEKTEHARLFDHEIDPCDCSRHEDCEGFTVNDRCKVGTIEIEVDDSIPTDEQIFSALVDGGFLKTSVAFADVEIDDPSCDGASLYLNQASDGCPIFQVERTDSEGGSL